MRQFTQLSSRVAPVPITNIDTDQIIPAAYLKITDKSGLGAGLFANWRYSDPQTKTPNPEFVLNHPDKASAQILLAGDNFGCGSSREHAPWALLEWGFRAVISTSFGDIFKSNALKNGLLVVQVTPSEAKALFTKCEEDPEVEIHIDLEQQTVAAPGTETASFEIDSFAKHCLLGGLDQLGYLLDKTDAITAYESDNPARFDTRAPLNEIS